MCLLAEVPLARVLLREALLVAKKEMVLVVSGLLEKKEKIHWDRRHWGRGRYCCFLALRLGSGTLGAFPLWLAGLGGIGSHNSGLYRCAGLLIQQMKICECMCNSVKIESVWVKEFKNLP